MIQFDDYLVLNKAYIKMAIGLSVGLTYECPYYPVHATTLIGQNVSQK